MAESQQPSGPRRAQHQRAEGVPGLADPARAAGRPRHGGRLWRWIVDWHEVLFVEPLRAGVRRGAREQADLVTVLATCEALGVENPVGYHTLELYPELIANYHDWHRRQGLDQAPHPGICC